MRWQLEKKKKKILYLKPSQIEWSKDLFWAPELSQRAKPTPKSRWETNVWVLSLSFRMLRMSYPCRVDTAVPKLHLCPTQFRFLPTSTCFWKYCFLFLTMWNAWSYEIQVDGHWNVDGIYETLCKHYPPGFYSYMYVFFLPVSRALDQSIAQLILL